MSPRALRRQADHGFMMIEVVIAIALAASIIGALAVLLVHANDSTLSDQRLISAQSAAEQRIEQVREVASSAYGFAAVALSSQPAAGQDASLPTDPTDPNDYVQHAGTAQAAYLIESNWNGTSEGTIDGGSTYSELLQVQATGLDPSDPACATSAAIAPVVYVDLATGAFSCATPTPATDPYATVYTYITQAGIGCNTGTANGSTSCTSGSGIAGDARRVIVAALVNSSTGSLTHGPEYPVYVSTLLANPVPSNQVNQANGLRIGVNIG
jgi:type II secretory pathway pseudopilin PulG